MVGCFVHQKPLANTGIACRPNVRWAGPSGQGRKRLRASSVDREPSSRGDATKKIFEKNFLPAELDDALKYFLHCRDPTQIMEPLARTFLLGVASGTFVELAHVFYKLHGLVSDVGTERMLQVLPSFANHFSPCLYTDHVVAFVAWLVLYGLEMVAVASLLRSKPEQDDYAEELAKLRTLSKKMLPASVQNRITKMLLNWQTQTPAVLGQASAAGLQRQSPISSPTAVTKYAFQSSPPLVELELEPKPMHPPTILPPAVSPNEPGEDSVRRREKELKDRKSYLRNFWYAAALSENVGEEPFHVKILSMNLVLYRGKDGKVHCLRDSCPHRSAPLSSGTIKNIKGHDCLVCPYHGWALDESGCIQDVPSETDGHWPRTQQVETYVVEERGGFIWLFYEGPKGNRLPADERPPIPCIPELEDPDWSPVYGELEFECGHFAVFENAIDMAHIHYLHGDSFGNDEKPVVMNMDGTTDAFGVTTTFNIHNKPVNPLWKFAAVESVPVVAKAMLPSTSMIRIELGMGIEFITFVCTVPISEDKCINRFALLRNFLPWAPEFWEPWARDAMFKILGEDKAMIEQLRPEETLREVSVRADLPQILFRKLRQQYIDMGYGYSHRSYDADRRCL